MLQLPGISAAVLKMIEALALTIVVLTGLCFIALAAVSLLMPARTSRFLLGLAGSALAHYMELILRSVVGAAFVLQAPRMLFSAAFMIFGWVLLITTACLLLMSWRRPCMAAPPNTSFKPTPRWNAAELRRWASAS